MLSSMTVLAMVVLLESALVYFCCHLLFTIWRPLPVLVFGTVLYLLGWDVRYWVFIMVYFPASYFALFGAPALSSSLRGAHSFRDTFFAFWSLFLGSLLSFWIVFMGLNHRGLRHYFVGERDMDFMSHFLAAMILPSAFSIVVWLVLHNRRAAARASSAKIEQP
jgi:hypothetical protein